jgi:hypothetical protein
MVNVDILYACIMDAIVTLCKPKILERGPADGVVFPCLRSSYYLASPSAPPSSRMRRVVSTFCALATFALFQSVSSAQTAVTDPVGFITLNVQGTGGSGSNALSFLGLGFTQVISYQAMFSSASGTTLTDSSTTWVDNQFNGANGTFYVELISGSGAGRTSNIVSTSGTGKSITTAVNLSSFVASGTGYKIRKNWTVATVFGPNNEAGLQGGTSSTADQILVYNPANGQYTTYYYKTSGVGGIGWRTTASTSANASNSPFNPTDGILIKRQQSSTVGFALAGAVKLGQTSIPVATGLNILSNVYPSGTFTLGTCGLFESGIGGGTSTTADQVQIYNSANGQYSTYYYKTSGVGGTGWRSTLSTSADASGTPIPFGLSIIIQRLGGRPAFQWVAPQPFTIL